MFFPLFHNFLFSIVKHWENKIYLSKYNTEHTENDILFKDKTEKQYFFYTKLLICHNKFWKSILFTHNTGENGNGHFRKGKILGPAEDRGGGGDLCINFSLGHPIMYGSKRLRHWYLCTKCEETWKILFIICSNLTPNVRALKLQNIS